MRALRWFLVALLPVAGFLIGLTLTPEHQPVWKTTFSRQMVLLGLIDNGSTALLLQQYNSSNNQRDLVGVDTRTGEQRFNLPIHQELSEAIGVNPNCFHLLPESQTILLLDTNGRTIYWYDWKKQQVIRKVTCETKEIYLRINGQAARGNTVAAFGYTNDTINTSKAFVTCWDATTGKVLRTIPVGPEANDLQLSEDGSLASIVCGTSGNYALALIDIASGKILQLLPDYVHDLRWSTDNRRLFILKAGVNNLIETLVRQGDKYNSLSEKVVSPPGIIPTHASPNFAIARWTRYHWLRRWLHARLNLDAGRLLEQLWPGMVILTICHPESGETLRSLTLPESKINTRFYPATDLEGVYIPHDYTLSYWSFAGAVHWPKWLGLGIGVVLATMLARKNLEMSPRQRAASASASKPITA